MKRVVFVIPVVAVALTWWAAEKVPATFSAARTPASVPALHKPSALSPAAIFPVQPTVSVTAKVSAAQGSPKMERPFKYPHELASYVDLQTKVFLNESEQREKAELLRHGGLLRALGQRLLEPTRNLEIIHQQDAAIDFLLEALKQGDRQVAGEVLQTVVKDAQVEDTTLERGAREQLAGLKAEILYQWSSSTPDITSSLQTWLPGPVSQKIWANVLKMQQSNLAESQAEARAKSH